ncbi:MAG: hypothetical protein II208_04400 [Alphaproteobacteria bacterium]|nr:hypothetical protein [Alphaproteobacteria bacterium]
MAEKSVKKSAPKKSTAKKTVAKPATAKKTAVKKVAPAPVVEMHECGCAHGCACHGHCGHKKCTFGRFVKKLIIFLIIFAMGFATATFYPMKKYAKMPPRPEFENGCLVVKCKKMAEMVPMMDTNKDNCVNREEFRAARKMMHKNKRDTQKQIEPENSQPETVVAE